MNISIHHPHLRGPLQYPVLLPIAPHSLLATSHPPKMLPLAVLYKLTGMSYVLSKIRYWEVMESGLDPTLLIQIQGSFMHSELTKEFRVSRTN